MRRDEANQKLAEWLGWTNLSDADGTWSLWGNQPDGRRTKVPDFYTDEAANALLLDKMPEPMLMRDGNTWNCAIKDGAFSIDTDRKTAICEAALKLIAKPTAEKEE